MAAAVFYGVITEIDGEMLLAIVVDEVVDIKKVSIKTLRNQGFLSP
jgi:hypothetical protein